jgi:hypothetical protein
MRGRMLDTVFWTATFVAISFGLFLICIEIYEQWATSLHVDADEVEVPPSVQLRRLAFRIDNEAPTVGRAH